MNTRTLVGLLFLGSLAESAVVNTVGWPVDFGRKIEFLFLAYLPPTLWAWLMVRLKQTGTLRNLYFAGWFWALLLGGLSARLLVKNEWAGLLWYAVQFWWGIIGIFVWLLVGIFRRVRQA
jgi:hypothetical protein